jgi:hypothetical protein
MLHLPFANEFLDSRRHVLDWHIRIDSVLVEQVDMVCLQARERFVSHFPNAFRATVQTAGRKAVLEAEFCGDDYLVADWAKGFTEQIFVGERSIGLGRVEEGHAMIKSRADQFDRFIFVHRGTKSEAHAHATETDGGDFQIAFSKVAFLHL